MEKQRIEFIDLAKGICIIFVVMGHCGIHPRGIMIENMQMPFFFLFSGMFFKTYGSFHNLIVNKVNKLIIPFSLFFIASLCQMCLWDIGSNIIHHKSLFDSIFRRIDLENGLISPGTFANNPIWFLLALFWCSIIFLFIYNISKKWHIQALLSTIFGTIGCYLSYTNIYLPFYLGTAFTALPFFYMGFVIKSTPLLTAYKYNKITTIISIIILIAYTTILNYIPLTVSYYINYIDSVNMPIHYIVTTIVIVAFLQLCKQIKHIPYISYIGKNTITILCTHMVIREILLNIYWQNNKYGFLQLDGLYLNLPLFLMTMVLSTAAIPFFKKYIPFLIGQKDLIKSNK